MRVCVCVGCGGGCVCYRMKSYSDMYIIYGYMVKVGVMCSGVGTPFRNSAEKSPPKKSLGKKSPEEKSAPEKNV